MKQFLEKYNPAIYFLYAIMLLLPFGGVPVVYCLVALVLDFIIQQKWQSLNGVFDFKSPLLWMMVFYFFICLSMFWTTNTNEGWFELQQKFSLLIIPILIFANKDVIQQNVKKVLLAFVASNVLVSLYLICRGYLMMENNLTAVHNQTGYLPFYSDFSAFLHVAYASFYVAFSIIILGYFLLKNKKLVITFLYGCCILILLVALYYLSSKAVFLAFIAMLIVTFTFIFWQSKHKLLISGVAIVIVSISILALKNNPRIYSIKTMLTELVHPESTSPETSSDASNGQRIYVIKSSIEVIKNNFLIGVGAGDVIDELEKQYMKSDYKVLAKKKLNCHNQFLESFVELGFFGFLVFLLITIGTLVYSVYKRNFLLFTFIIGFIIVANTESFLNHQAGVVFFVLFVSILVLDFEIKKSN